MLDPVVFLSALTVVEAIEGSDQIAGYTPYTVERDIRKTKFQIYEIPIGGDSHFLDLAVAVLVFSVFDVSVDFLLGNLFSYDIYLDRHNNSSVKNPAQEVYCISYYEYHFIIKQQKNLLQLQQGDG